jgi:hypothetical protein
MPARAARAEKEKRTYRYRYLYQPRTGKAIVEVSCCCCCCAHIHSLRVVGADRGAQKKFASRHITPTNNTRVSGNPPSQRPALTIKFVQRKSLLGVLQASALLVILHLVTSLQAQGAPRSFYPQYSILSTYSPRRRRRPLVSHHGGAFGEYLRHGEGPCQLPVLL